MPKIETLDLYVNEPQIHKQFYIDILEMHELANGRVGYSEEQMGIRFVQSQGDYEHRQADLYWKFAIAVPDLDLAYRQLIAKGIDVTAPRQFRDVGYLTKIITPEGFVIELIQHVFEGESSLVVSNCSRLGGGPSVNLLTLRCHDINQVDDFCINKLGMQPLSVQSVEPYGFTLYFYAFTEESPPDSDLNAVVNRSWVYQRPYTVLEVQHLHNTNVIKQPQKNDVGYGGAIITGISFDKGNILGLMSENYM